MLGRKLFITLIGVSVVLAVISCAMVYEISLQGSWEIDEYYKNGADDTQAFHLVFGDYVIKFHPDGDFTETYKAMNLLPVTNPGTWEIINNGSQLRLIDENITRTFDIMSVTNDELRLYRELGEGGDEELLLEPKEEM
jgi:hypothetical protein